MSELEYHVGNRIKEFLKSEGRSEVWLAKGVHCDPGNFNRTLKKESLDTDLLRRISVKLKHNFCAEYARFVEKQIQAEMRSDIIELP
ncbi:MAG: XRE family transcriptional regulator [Bacteroidales bacterium]|nr:XRE family transcriptional regulator [Bacteroidales bacterium]